MFGFGAATRIYLAPGATDMRKGFEGLYGLVRDRLQCDPLSGHVFSFANAQRNRLKVVVLGRNWVCGFVRSGWRKAAFTGPNPATWQGKIVLSHEQFAMLLGGIDLEQTRPRRWYRKPVAAKNLTMHEIPHKHCT